MRGEREIFWESSVEKIYIYTDELSEMIIFSFFPQPTAYLKLQFQCQAEDAYVEGKLPCFPSRRHHQRPPHQILPRGFKGKRSACKAQSYPNLRTVSIKESLLNFTAATTTATMESPRGIVVIALVLGLAAIVSAGTSVSTGKSYSTSSSSSNSKTVAPESERGGWGWAYPTGHSWNSGLSSVGLPLVLIPLIYFGFLWCVLLFGVAAFHHVPQHHGGGGHGHGWGHHRYRRHDVDADLYTQERVLSSI